jgi:hypothetical protein
MTAHLFIGATLRQQLLLLLLLLPWLLHAHAWIALGHLLRAWIRPHAASICCTCTPIMLLVLVPLLLLLYWWVLVSNTLSSLSPWVTKLATCYVWHVWRLLRLLHWGLGLVHLLLLIQHLLLLLLLVLLRMLQ